MTLHDFLALVLASDGDGAAPSNPGRETFLALVDPRFARSSTCGVALLGWLRAAGARHPLLDAPTRQGMAFADLLTIARAFGALHGPDRDPQQGDAVIVGHLGPGDALTLAEAGGTGHVWLDVGEADDNGRRLGIEGGQRDDAGAQVIRCRWHELRGGYDRTGDDAPTGQARRVRYVIDVGAIVDAA